MSRQAGPIPLSEFRMLDIPPVEPLVEGLLAEGQSMMLYAPPGHLKTMVAMGLGLIIANGNGASLGDWTVTKPGRKVLYIDAEMSPSALKKRADTIIRANELSDEGLYMWSLMLDGCGLMDITTTDVQTDILARAVYHDVEFIVIDNVRSMTDGGNENDSAYWDGINRMVREARTNGISTLMLHHANKGGSYFAGSSNAATTFEVMIGLDGLEKNYETSSVRLTVGKDREAMTRNKAGVITFNSPNGLVVHHRAPEDPILDP